MSPASAGGHLSLGEAVAATESRLFVGRAVELDALSKALADSAQAPVVVYLHGSSGSGKSALLRQFRRRAERMGASALLIDAADLSPAPARIVGALAEALACAEPDAPPSTARVVAEANRRAQSGPVALLIDNYEQLRPADGWFRSQVLYGLGPHVLVVLTGHRAPADLWGGDTAWLATIRPLPLAALARTDALEYLRCCGVEDPALRAEAAAVSGGHPLLLGMLAGIALRGGHSAGPRPRSETLGLAGRLLEELTLGADPPELRDVLAAAALVRVFDRELLAVMVGQAAVDRAWDALLALPVVMAAGHRRAIHESVREHLASAAARDRPWMVRRWRRRAIDGYLRAGPVGSEREDVARLAAHALWHPWLHPAAEAADGWRLERGALAVDAPELADCLGVMLRSLGGTPDEVEPAQAALDRYLQVWPAGFTIVRDGGLPPVSQGLRAIARQSGAGHARTATGTADAHGSRILGWACAVPLSRHTRPVLLADPALGPYLQAQPAGTLAAWEGRSLAFCQIGVADAESEVHHVLVRAMLGDFAPFDRVLAVSADVRVQTFLVRLGFRPDAEFTGTLGGGARQTRAFVLDLAGGGYGEWLRGRLAFGGSAAVAPDQWANVAQETLDALADPARLHGSTVAEAYRQIFRATLEPDALHAWVVDALVELGRSDEGLRRVLAAYHLDRIGSHELVAERLRLSQRTYYRRRRQALEELGRILFA